MSTQNTFGTRSDLTVGGKTYEMYTLGKAGFANLDRLPFSMKVLLENLLRHEDGVSVTREDIEAVAHWNPAVKSNREIAYRVARVVLQDFTGVPAVVDLAAMRDAMVAMGGDGNRINPLAPADLVIDHSVQVDHFGSKDAFRLNAELEFDRNKERYALLRWGQKAFQDFRVVPPDTGIVHQVNLEYLAQCVFQRQVGGKTVVYPDTCVGTDSHTTMINGLGVVGWGVGGIEAEAALLGQPTSMLIPEVIGFRLSGRLPEGTTATDLVLRVTEMLRKKGVVEKFVEFYGPGLASLSLPDRATIANMAPEYGATIGFFPVDAETIAFLRFSGRSEQDVALVEAYCKAQGLYRTEASPEPVFTDTLSLDLGDIEPAMAGPKRPQDRVTLKNARAQLKKDLPGLLLKPGPNVADDLGRTAAVSLGGDAITLRHGSVVLAAITSCTNTSNPSVLIAAGLLAKKARARGLSVKPWVKTSLAPGSKVVVRYLEEAGLLAPLEALNFHVVGFGCMTCIGNSGPLPDAIEAGIKKESLVVASVLSGNRNFEGRIHPLIRANYLMSPPLVVAYALAGTMDIDLAADALGTGTDGQPVRLADIWPSTAEVAETLKKALRSDMFKSEYGSVFEGDASWRSLPVPDGATFAWDVASTYVKNPPYFVDMPKTPGPVRDVIGARVLGKFADSITTDHISPAGSIKADSPAGRWLQERGVTPADFNSYGARRGNHEVMVRGTFANVRLKNQIAPGTEGGVTTYLPTGEVMPIYDASVRYLAAGTPLVVLAGKEYGTGSSRDWAAKGTMLLGVKAVIAESFERIHRSNLVGMGVLPLVFQAGDSHGSLGLSGEESFDIQGLAAGVTPGMTLTVRATAPDGAVKTFPVRCRIDTPAEVEYFRHGGILQYVLRNLASA